MKNMIDIISNEINDSKNELSDFNIDNRIKNDILEDSLLIDEERPSIKNILELLSDKEITNDMSLNEIQFFLEILKEDICESLGIEKEPLLNVCDLENDTLCGFYDEKTNFIYINETLLPELGETIDTIIHECRHCYQIEYIKDYNIQDELKEYFFKGFEEYVNGEDNYLDYYFNPIEVDAREYTSNLLNEYGYTKGDFYYEL